MADVVPLPAAFLHVCVKKQKRHIWVAEISLPGTLSWGPIS